MGDNRTRRSAIAALCVFAAAAVFSCAFLQRGPARVLEIAPDEGGEPLAVSASFVSPEDKVPGFFKKALADSGVLALQVLVRNDGPRPLLVHDPNGMRLGPGFAGIRLVCGADTFAPLHPGEVSAILKGAGRTAGYRKPGVLGIAGSFLIPPYGVYTLYQEASIGRFYRPLVSRSLFPALPSGMLAPVRLDPGTERKGWLYFDAPSAASGRNCELLITACLALDGFPIVPGYDFAFSRRQGEAGGGGDDSEAANPAAGEYLFSLVRENKRSGLFCISAGALIDDPPTPAVRIGTVAAKEASIADAARRGERAVLGVNFTSKSRALEIRCGAEPSIRDDHSFSRAIKRIFPAEGGTCVVTETGYGYFIDGNLRSGVYGGKLTRGFDDAVLIGERLLVFARDKGLLAFDVSSRPRFAVVEKRDLRRGTRHVVGMMDDALVLLCRGRRLLGDTLVVCDPAAAAEIGRGALAGRVVLAWTAQSSVVLQLEDGTVLRVAPAPLGKLRIEEAGWLPFAARALLALPGGFVAVAADGRMAAGEVYAFRPGARGAIPVSVPIRPPGD